MIIPDIDYLQDVCLSKSQHELLLEKLQTSLDTLKHVLRRRNEAIVYNRCALEKEPTPRYIGSRSYDYHIRIRNLIAVVRLYKKLVDVNATVIKWLELYT